MHYLHKLSIIKLFTLAVVLSTLGAVTVSVAPSHAADQQTAKTITKTESVGFKTKKQDDPNLPTGQTKVIIEGKKGSKKVVYKITYVNGKQKKKQISSKVIKKPVTKVVAIGAYVAPAPAPAPAPEPEPAYTPPPAQAVSSGGCDQNYTPCIPYYEGNALNCSDIGVMIQVIGYDHNKFDADHDGYGCESYR